MAERDLDSPFVKAGNGLVVLFLLGTGAYLLATAEAFYVALLPLALGILGLPGVVYPRASYLRIVYWIWV